MVGIALGLSSTIKKRDVEFPRINKVQAIMSFPGRKSLCVQQ
jgi:hypothetical protein